MPNTPISLLVPSVCPACGQAGRVKLQQTMKGEAVILEWACGACDAEWRVTRKEQVLAETSTPESGPV
jgi:hypothetical protein